MYILICQKIIFHSPILGQIRQYLYSIFRQQPSSEIKWGLMAVGKRVAQGIHFVTHEKFQNFEVLKKVDIIRF